MWDQRRAFSPYGEHKGLAWLLFLSASWGTVPFVPQKRGLLYHLPLCIVPTQCPGIDRGCWHLPCRATCGAVLPTHFLPAWDAEQFQMPSPGSSWHNPADWLWFLKLLQNWPQLMVAPQKSETGHWLRALNPNWLPVYLFTHFWRGREGRKGAALGAESPTSDWLLRLLKE